MKKTYNIAQLIFIMGLVSLVGGASILLLGHQGLGEKIFVYGFWILPIGTIVYIFDLFRNH